MESRAERMVRVLVGLSLVAGAFLLLSGGVQYGVFAAVPGWAVALAGALGVALTLVTVFTEGGPWTPPVPAALWIGSVLGAMLWAHLDPAGHGFLAGYASIVALAIGIGLLRRQLWAWPVGLASVVGFGPIVLLLAPLPAALVVGGFVLFLVDVVGLLVIHRTYFEPRW